VKNNRVACSCVVGGVVSLFIFWQIYRIQRKKEEAIDERTSESARSSQLLRRFTNEQLMILETYYQAGLTRPTDSEVTEILQKIGKDGESGLSISKNIIVMWFCQRRQQPKQLPIPKYDSQQDD